MAASNKTIERAKRFTEDSLWKKATDDRAAEIAFAARSRERLECRRDTRQGLFYAGIPAGSTGGRNFFPAYPEDSRPCEFPALPRVLCPRCRTAKLTPTPEYGRIKPMSEPRPEEIFDFGLRVAWRICGCGRTRALGSPAARRFPSPSTQTSSVAPLPWNTHPRKLANG